MFEIIIAIIIGLCLIIPLSIILVSELNEKY